MSMTLLTKFTGDDNKRPVGSVGICPVCSVGMVYLHLHSRIGQAQLHRNYETTEKTENVPLVELMHLVFKRMPGEVAVGDPVFVMLV